MRVKWLRLGHFKLVTLATIHCHHSLHSVIHAIASASFCLPQSPLPTSYQYCSCLSQFSTGWPFSLEFPDSSSQIYQLLHCLQIQSKPPPFLWCTHFWPLTILSMRFWFDILVLIFRLEIILWYVTLICVISMKTKDANEYLRIWMFEYQILFK